jgi:hypothetical protein
MLLPNFSVLAQRRTLRTPLLLPLGVLLPVLVLLLLPLGVWLFVLVLLLFAFLPFRLVLIFVLLFVLWVAKGSGSEKHEQKNCRADASKSFHECCLHV